MYSIKCPHRGCNNLITMKTEEIREAVAQAESAKQSHYEMHCPKCRKPIKIQVKELKRKLPPTPQPAAEEEHAPAADPTTGEESPTQS
jgi:hypothetical protein